VQRPLATVVVGGMFIGPLLLLVVAPALRRIFLASDTTETIRAAPNGAQGDNGDGLIEGG
jgi:heavy metal efflux system protein